MKERRKLHVRLAKGIWQTAKAMMNLYPDKGAQDLLNEPVKPAHSFNPLVQIETARQRRRGNPRMTSHATIRHEGTPAVDPNSR